eukprot:3478217-Karenia_brevis.AAC.1
MLQVVWDCPRCQLPHHNPSIKYCRKCHFPRPPVGASPGAGGSSEGLALSKSLDQYCQKMQIVAEGQPQSTPISATTATVMEIDSDDTTSNAQPTTTPLLTAQRQLHHAQLHHQRAVAEFGPEDPTTTALGKTVKDLEQKLSGVAISKGQLEHHQSLLEVH